MFSRFLYLSIFLLAACSLDPSKNRSIDPDEEFAKLEGPEVLSVKDSLESNALDALKNGDYSKSSSLYQQLVHQEPDEMRYALGWAESLRRLGEHNSAIGVYEKIVQKQPGHLDAHEGMALSLMAQGEVEESSQIFKRLIDRDPKRWRSYNALGILFAIKGLPRDGMKYLKEAMKINDRNPSVLNNVGLIQAIGGNYTKAIDALQKSARIADGGQRKQIELNMALVHGIFGDLPKAKLIAEKHLTGASLRNNLGLYAHLAKDDELAKSYLNMALSGSPVHYERAWENLEMIKEGGGTPHFMTPNQKSYRVQ